jgi:hypothetical protein
MNNWSLAERTGDISGIQEGMTNLGGSSRLHFRPSPFSLLSRLHFCFSTDSKRQHSHLRIYKKTFNSQEKRRYHKTTRFD